MTELARGTVQDRPWGRTLGALGARGLSGELTIHANGKPHRIAFSSGAVVGASSPLLSDSAVRVALTGGLISSIHVADITRRIAAAPNRDEVDVIVEAVRLGADQGQRLRRRLVAQRAARTFSLDRGNFVVEDQVTVPVLPGNEMDVRAIVYLGAKSNISEERLAQELNQYGAWFKLTPAGVADLTQFGFTDVEMPVLHKLVEGQNLEELERQLPEVGERTVRAVVYALASAGACEIEQAPRPVVGRITRNSIPLPSRTTSRVNTPIPSRTATPTSGIVSRTQTPTSASGPVISRTHTPLSVSAVVARTQTPTSASGPVISRTSTSASGPVISRTQTPAPSTPPLTSRTHTPNPPAAARTGTPNNVSVGRATTPPTVGRVSTLHSQPNSGPVISRTISGDRSRVPSAPPHGADSGAHRAESSGLHSVPHRASSPSLGRSRRNTPATIETEGLIRDRVALVDRGADHFVLLGLARDASPDLIRAAYFSLARKLHPDRLASLGIVDALRDAQRLFAQINTAFSVLNDPVRRIEYLDILSRGGQSAVDDDESKADELAMRVMHAEEAFKRGEMALRREQLDVALQEFSTAVELQPNEAEYTALYAWAKFLTASDKQAVASQIRLQLTRAAEKLEQSPTARYYLGRVERMLGREREALTQFQEVLRIKPNHVEASGEIRVLEARLKNKR